MRQEVQWDVGYTTPQLYFGLQDQCVQVTEESKALLEEYNKTVSFVLHAS